MQLFALTVKQDSGVLGNERKYVEQFLTQQLRKEIASEYLDLFDKYAVTEEVEVLVSVKDSVRVLRICQQINTTLTQRQKVVVLLRVFELVNAVPKFTVQRMFIINTIAEVFNLADHEYQSIRDFVVGNQLEKFDIDNVLVMTNHDFHRQHALFLKNEELSGILVFLHVPSVDLYFLRYLGGDEVLLNGTLINKHQIGLFPMGSNIKLPQHKPFYYGDIVAQFYANSFSNQLLLEAKNIHLRFANNAIGLRNISFSERNGQLVGIMGASGSGKTTLLNVLCGLEKPTSGEVLINGVNLHTNKKELEGFIGYIPQDDVLIEELTVADNLYYNAQLCFRDKTRDELETLISKTLHSLGLYEIRNLKVGSFMNKTISGGQRKRLNIALELLREPSILFVDEPTSGLSSNDSENV
ncbi:MAG: ABC transporter ATP-binding protein, partial [Bacteroidales bacterium]|nr:ABC transporter ATP-binding protein [Bacteroidales bacterium]